MLCDTADIFSMGTILYEIFAKSIAAHDIAYTGAPEEFQVYATRVRRPCNACCCTHSLVPLVHSVSRRLNILLSCNLRTAETVWCSLCRWPVGTGRLLGPAHCVYACALCRS